MTDATLVIGGGTMGLGIVQVLLDVGATVTLVEPNAAAARRVTDSLGGRPGLMLIGEAVDPLEVGLVVEAVPEDLGLKCRILEQIEGVVPDHSVVASNTSSLSINAMAASLQHPERFIGMHFFNPVPKSLLVELVTGDRTSHQTTARATEWVQRLGKGTHRSPRLPWFATSRLGLTIGLEAIRMVEDGVATAEDIDRGMELGYKLPMGPLRLTDLVGLDVRLAIAEHLAEQLGPRFEPPALLRRMVAEGHLGRKTGQGFYQWS